MTNKDICNKYLFFILVLIVCSQNVKAQFFKRLKEKINNKLEQKTEEIAERNIDRIDTISFKKKKDKTPAFLGESYGHVNLNHSNLYEDIEITKIGKIEVSKTRTQQIFKGLWKTHNGLKFDGFQLTVTGSKKHYASKDLKQTFKIPEEATFQLAYDPNFPYTNSGNKSANAITDFYQNYYINTGSATVDVNLKEKKVYITFSGSGMLAKDEEAINIDINGSISSDMLIVTNNQPSGTTKNTANLDGTYEFTHEVETIITTADNASHKISYLLNPSKTYKGILADMSNYSDEDVQGESVIIMDDGNVNIFVNAMGRKIKMSRGRFGKIPMEDLENYNYNEVKKTGQSKTILGAICYEYLMEDKDMKMSLWVAPSVNLPNWFLATKEVINGYVMAYTITTKEGVIKSQTIAINDNIYKALNPKEYKNMF